ncbi:GNAT family N-acetyltransferase [Streptomyces roseochromogenus]|uniref:N-acetyltransferase domain-containing protein n=1 Tax=Streptomyces roseochromogenus subsp. oscitans DS 12.976 TaxID=1352936 RepID=V6KDT8_STRRC|nr:GNAT family N-acetyltransferase [Streptomyces roseochromogenus]EST29616.1 hypothetical protein M878_20005 [Streptomyces roseochromogenus subsp. oscitans DS 12.976]
MTDWTVAELGPHDRRVVTEAITLFEAVVGRGALIVDQALQGLHDGTLLFLAARSGTQSAVVGAATACVLDDDSYGELVAPMPASALAATPPSVDGRRIGRLGTLAVAASMRRRGVGSALTAQCTQWLRQRCTEAYTISWLHSEPDRSEGVLKAFGWQPVAVLHDYWVRATTTGEADCSQCGRPCHCPGLLLRLTGDR